MLSTASWRLSSLLQTANWIGSSPTMIHYGFLYIIIQLIEIVKIKYYVLIYFLIILKIVDYLGDVGGKIPCIIVFGLDDLEGLFQPR